MFKELKEIYDGWRNYITNNPEMEKKSDERLATCIGCDKNSTNGEIKMLSKCTECGCFLVAKSYSKGSKCPLDKWR